MIIVGAGLAGLLAAHAWPQAKVIEASPGPREMHKALLRFGTDNISKMTGIPFREVTVRKGIFYEHQSVDFSIQMANLYARKVLGGGIEDRSICNLKADTRYIAPKDFYDQLVAAVGNRIQWGTPFDEPMAVAAKATGCPIISTAPLPVMLDVLGVDCDFHFKKKPINVQRFLLPDADVFQTIYFPDYDSLTPVYRASITGDMLIIEFNSKNGNTLRDYDIKYVCGAYGINQSTLTPLGSSTQEYGKIIEMPDHLRKPLLFKLTHDHGIFSLGRFATYRNVMLDDVVEDISAIRRMLHSSSYELFKEMSR